jgi:tetratricopeptide (TPR) repeat protein
MVRSMLAAFGLTVVILPVFAEPTAEEAAFANALAVQRAMEQAKLALHTGDHAKAVQALEEQISRINGNAEYLRLMRSAYRGYIRDLLAAKQLPVAEKYRQRLLIIDGSAANDPELRPAMAESKNPASGKPSYTPIFAQVPTSKAGPAVPKPTPPAAAPTPPVMARGKVHDAFDVSNQRPTNDTGDRQTRAQALLAQAESEYSQRRFPQARLYFEQAYQMDPGVVQDRREQWAYCKLAYVVEQLNQTKLDAGLLTDLHGEVHSAVSMAPALDATGKRLLAKIGERSGAAGRVARGQSGPADGAADKVPASERSYTIQHQSGSGHGWSITETSHFRIFHRQPREYIEKVAHMAERTRYDMYRKWFGAAGPEWHPKCDVYLHATADEYMRADRAPATSPGHSRIDKDNGTGRIVARTIHLRCDNPNMLEAVLPHETTHVVLAGQFGGADVPRWADEGIAVLAEPEREIDKHRKNLARCHKDGTLIPVRDLVHMPDYPQPRYISAFYAQSVVLCEFLAKQRGPQTLTAFIRDGLKEGYDTALRKQYGWDWSELQEHWNHHLTAELSRAGGMVTAGR